MAEERSWRIYRGTGEPHDGIDRLPAPPPWRTFNGVVPAQLPAAPVDEDSKRGRVYLPDDEVVEMTNAALYLRRPLLVTGKPGTGKSTLAYSVAHELRLGRPLYWPITSRSQLHDDGLYRYDAIGRLQQVNLHVAEPDAATRPPWQDIGRYIRLGPLGTALLPRRRPRVLLVDELDKSDIDLPNDLLNVMEEGKFEITELTRWRGDEPTTVMTDDPGVATEVADGMVCCKEFPLIVITSNGEREFPPAFLRRCLRLTVQPPNADKLAKIVAAQLGEASLVEVEGGMIDEFVSIRDTVDLATDQLLNAAYLATSGIQPDPAERRRIVRELFRGLGPAEP